MNCIHPPSLTLPRCRYMGSAWLSRAASWFYRPVATDQPVEKQKIRLLCNFFAIRDSFLFPQSGNRLLNSRLPALLHRDLRSGESITIPNRKKVAIRADCLFSISPQRLQGGVGAEQPKFGVAGWFKCGSNLALRIKSTTV